MGRFHGVKLLILFPVLVFAFPATNVKQTFDPISQREVPSHNVPSQLGRSISIKSYPAPFHSNGPQQLDRRNSDASSFRAKPSSNFAWTPIKLGGWSFHGSFLLDQSLTQSRLEGQSLGVLLDIGSAEFWVSTTPTGPVTQQQDLLPNTQLYDPSKSSTWQPISNGTFEASYQSGTILSGFCGTDILTLGDVIPIKQVVGVVSTQVSLLIGEQIQGILGLGLGAPDQTSGTLGSPTFLDIVTPMLAAPLFTVGIDGDGTGSWDFGHIDSTKYTGTLMIVPVDEQCAPSVWTLGAFNAVFPEGLMNANCAVLDSGYDLIDLPNDVTARYYQDVPGFVLDTVSDVYRFPCNTTLPDLTFNIDGGIATVPGKLLNYRADNDGTNLCTGALQNTAGSNIALLGQTFMKAQFVVFNLGDQTISFADYAFR